MTATRKAIAATGAEAVELAEGTGYLLPEDFEPAPDPGREAHTTIDDEVPRLTDFLTGTRVTPAYRTPLERRLATS
ncbi:hypothetical protein [Streptomyces sp. NPDC051183]|uniref:hypothetical protein n=1 Tax=unclassified Streptomyces TaxID=2593676 RepID=UPI0034235BD4